MSSTGILKFCFYWCLFCQFSCTGSKVNTFPIEVLPKIPQLISLEDTINHWIDAGIVPSMAVAVAWREEILWMNAYGMADKEKRIPATPQSSYALGSLSKSISATGVMTLVETGKIELEAPINYFMGKKPLRSFRWDTDSVKVWHILNSSAGIPHGWTTSDDSTFFNLDETKKDEIFHRYALVTFPPGQVAHYSNYSFGVADRLIENVSGQSLEDFFQTAVFKPLGMKNSYTQYWPDHAASYASLYDRLGDEIEPYHFIPLGGGGHYSSVSDLLRYGLFYSTHLLQDQHQILSPKTIDRMFRFDKSVGKIFQLGWHNPGHAIVSNGSISGANSNLTIIPSEELLVVCLTNITSSKADELSDAIVKALAPDLEKQYTYQDYMAEFGNSYKPNNLLKGTWTGTLKAEGGDLPIELAFGKKVMIRVNNDEAIPLQDPVFNRHNELRGRFEGNIQVPELLVGTQSSNQLVLNLIDNELVGHVAVSFSNQKGSFRYGVYCSLKSS